MCSVVKPILHHRTSVSTPSSTKASRAPPSVTLGTLAAGASTSTQGSPARPATTASRMLRCFSFKQPLRRPPATGPKCVMANVASTHDCRCRWRWHGAVLLKLQFRGSVGRAHGHVCCCHVRLHELHEALLQGVLQGGLVDIEANDSTGNSPGARRLTAQNSHQESVKFNT